MNLTKQKLYKLIMEQVQRMYQAPNDLLRRLMADPDVPDGHREKLKMMLQSGDEDAIDSAREMMDVFGYGEEYATTDIPITRQDDPAKFQIGYGRDTRKKRMAGDSKLGKYVKMKPSQKNALDMEAKSVFELFKAKLPDYMDKEDERGSIGEETRVINFGHNLIDMFFERAEQMFPKMPNENFFGLEEYNGLLINNMITYYDNIRYERNQPIDDLFM